MEALYLRWLKKPKALRLLCLASSVVGVICYALSSTFNHLLGNWTWWKMLLYIVFSFMICLAVLFSPASSSSTSLRLEAHLAFLVLILTSVSSFLFDNAAKGEPDAYSLICCAAFATMSLGLSNLTQLGFWIDLLYFFCGSLIVQLMKMNLWLVIVGGGFSYCLLQLQLRYHPHDTQDHNLPLQVQNQVIIQIDDLESQRSQQANDDVGSTLQVQNQVIVRVHDSESQMSQQANADAGSTLGSTQEDGDLRFQGHLLMQSNSHPQDDGLIIQQHLMNCIKELEKENHMVCSDFKDKMWAYADVYLVMDAFPSGIRRRLKESVKLMVEAGIEEECSDIYSKWRREFLRQCLRALGLQFQTTNNEDVEKWLKTCLLSFVDTIVTTTFYQPNLFNIVPKMSETLDELMPEFSLPHFRKLWFEDDLEDVRQRLVIVNRLRKIIYLVTDGDHIENSTFWMIELLECELEAKSKDCYTEPTLGYVFMINNLSHIRQKMHYLKFYHVWFRQNTAKVKQNCICNCNLYLRNSWNKLLDFLKLETNESAEPDLTAELMKDKLHFEKTCTVQSTWTVSDKRQRERIVKSIEVFLLPEYANFSDRFRAVFYQAYDYIKFGIVDIQNCLSHLFLPDEEMDLQHKKTK